MQDRVSDNLAEDNSIIILIDYWLIDSNLQL